MFTACAGHSNAAKLLEAVGNLEKIEFSFKVR